MRPMYPDRTRFWAPDQIAIGNAYMLREWTNTLVEDGPPGLPVQWD